MPESVSRQTPENSRVRIRMYRQGLGDCFLLTFYGDREPRQVLIDCGLFNGTPGGQAKIRRVAENIAQETGGKVDALVVSHEHWDHVSGFFEARDIFDQLAVGEIWLAWTEDPSHPLARDLKRQHRLKLQAIHLALAQLAKSGEPHLQPYGQGIADLLGFFGDPVEGASLAAFSERTAEAMAKVTRRQPPPTFWKPGDLIQRSWLPDVRLYVLAPPLDPARLKQRQVKPGTETYGLAGGDGAFFAALEDLLAAEGDLDDPGRGERLAASLPFHPSLQWRVSKPHEAKIKEHRHLGPLYQEYQAKDAAWRRIDHDWLMSAARLGLQLDNATNNTSLVLAIELVKTGEILLFPGDAQTASWKSWRERNWRLPDAGGGTKTVSGAELLGRTVFYKVGHHGSHNATLKEGGLELMTSPNLVAAIPVHQEFAHNTKNWEMPAPALLKRLRELTRGRLLFADTPWPAPGDPPPPGLSTGEWQQFLHAVHLDPNGLFIDYYL